MVVVVLSRAGDQVPVMPLIDVVGKGLNVAPGHIAAGGGKAGTTLVFTVMVNVCVVAHCPAAGVNV